MRFLILIQNASRFSGRTWQAYSKIHTRILVKIPKTLLKKKMEDLLYQMSRLL